jgi:hypothetical protein
LSDPFDRVTRGLLHPTARRPIASVRSRSGDPAAILRETVRANVVGAEYELETGDVQVFDDASGVAATT